MEDALSLRLRLIGAIALVLLLALMVGGALTYIHAEQKVAVELAAALDGASNTVVQILAETPEPSADTLDQIARVFDGNRHVRLELLGANGEIINRSRLSDPLNDVPDWFVGAIAGRPDTISFAAPPSAAPAILIRLVSDNRSEIDEVWGDLILHLAVLGGFAVVSFILVSIVIGRSLAPLESVSAAFTQIGAGATDVRLAIDGSPEIRALCRACNDMAGRLSAMSLRNRQLSDQLLRLQDEERAELARDLHDEVGPYLFALDVDAAAIATLASADDGPRSREIGQRAAAVREAAAHARTHVRTILGHLRPGLAGSLGLAQAVRDIVSFHVDRHPDVTFQVDAPERSLGAETDAVLLAVIREAVSNALRHAAPKAVEVTVAEMDGEVAFAVTDDGKGLPQGAERNGYGLINMRERVEAAGGMITIAGRRSGGTSVSGVLPGGARSGKDETEEIAA